MMESGFATADDIDAGMVEGCAHPMGPLRLADLIGLDTTMAVAESLYAEFKEQLYAPPPCCAAWSRRASSGARRAAGSTSTSAAERPRRPRCGAEPDRGRVGAGSGPGRGRVAVRSPGGPAGTSDPSHLGSGPTCLAECLHSGAVATKL